MMSVTYPQTVQKTIHTYMGKKERERKSTVAKCEQ